MITRRTFVVGAGAIPALSLIGRPINGDALEQSKLIYVTPLKSDGEESRCKGEVWFAYDGESVFVVTPPATWRARAVRRGLTRARMWVGEFGQWKRAGNAFRRAPELLATGVLETNAEAHARVLEIMAGKYAREWPTWGPRFKRGLEDGSRVMIRYAIESPG